MPERDPIEALRNAWRDVDPPDPTPEEMDPRTRAALEWMRSAWRELEAPPARVPARLARRTLFRRLPELTRLAAAAALLAVAGASVLVFLDPGRPDPAPERTARRVVEAAPEEGVAVMEHGTVRLVMLMPTDVVGQGDVPGDLDEEY